MSNKTIQIDPNFFNISKSSKKTSKREKREKKEKNRNKNFVKPNKIKQQLLNRIKEKQLRDRENNTISNDITEDDDFKNTISYLEKIIKEKNLKKTMKKKKNVIDFTNDGENRENEINLINEKGPLKQLNKNPNNQPIQNTNIYTNNTKPNEIQQHTNHFNNFYNQEPKYGCLKGGTKPTFSQLNKTLKVKNVFKPLEIKESQLQEQLLNSNPQHNLQERQKKLNEIKMSFNTKKKKVKHIEKFKKLKKYRFKKLTKTYKLGKDKPNSKVSVLIKNNVTRKKVENEINELTDVPLIEIKRFLKNKNLLKIGSQAPEHLLRHIYKQSVLAGDIYNNNKHSLIHNFINKDENE